MLSKHSYCLTVGVPFLISSVSFKHVASQATLRWFKLSIVLAGDSRTRSCWHDAHLPCNSSAQVMGLGPLQHGRIFPSRIICHCLGFSCTAEISSPIHCLGMFMKSHRKSKEDLGLTVPPCNALRHREGKRERGRESELYLCTVRVQLLPVRTSPGYNRLQDNHLMLLCGCLPPV